MSTLQHVFNCYCIIFLMWMCFRWTTRTFHDSMVKVSLFLVTIIGIVIELTAFGIKLN